MKYKLELLDTVKLFGAVCFMYTMPMVFEIIFFIYKWISYILFEIPITPSSTIRMSLVLGIMGLIGSMLVLFVVSVCEEINENKTIMNKRCKYD